MSIIGDAVAARPRKIQVLNEIVKILREHIDQREEKIDGLENLVYLSKEKIKSLEEQLSTDEDWNQATAAPTTIQSTSTSFCPKSFASNPNIREYDEIDGYRLPKISNASRNFGLKEKPYYYLNHEAFPLRKSPHFSISGKYSQEELREKMVELGDLKSSTNCSEKAESVKTDSRSHINIDEEQSFFDLKTENNIIQEKLDRVRTISSENLLLHSDVADYQAELRDLRSETRDLRMRCYELNEEKKQNEAEIRDLRRFVEMLKSNQVADAKKDLLNKIEYYQMEHDRLMEEILRLKSRLGEISPRTSASEMRSAFQDQGSPSVENSTTFEYQKQADDDFSGSIERGRSGALAASMASSLAAGRLKKDRSLSPSAVLSFHDLTMDRYKQHLEEFNDASSANDVVSPDKDELEAGTSFVVRQITSENKESINFGSSPSRNKIWRDSVESGKEIAKQSKGSNKPGCAYNVEEVRPPSRSNLSPKRQQSSSSKKSCISNGSVKSLPKRAFAPRSAAELKLGHCIKFTRPGGKLYRGVVKYVGHLPDREEIYVGVELDGFDGRSSGSFEGTKYFSCPTNKGIFTPFSKVIMAWE